MWGCPRGTPPRSGSAPAGRISSVTVRRDRLWVGLEGLGAKVARGFGRELYSASACTSPLPGAEDKVPAVPSLPSGRDGAPRPRRDVNRVGLSSVRTLTRRAAGRGSAHVNWRQGSAAMSATHPTRLETRTKESNARASQRVPYVETPWRNESEGRRAPAEVGSRPLGAGRTTGPSRPLCRGGGA